MEILIKNACANFTLNESSGLRCLPLWFQGVKLEALNKICKGAWMAQQFTPHLLKEKIHIYIYKIYIYLHLWDAFCDIRVDTLKILP